MNNAKAQTVQQLITYQELHPDTERASNEIIISLIQWCAYRETLRIMTHYSGQGLGGAVLAMGISLGSMKLEDES